MPDELVEELERRQAALVKASSAAKSSVIANNEGSRVGAGIFGTLAAGVFLLSILEPLLTNEPSKVYAMGIPTTLIFAVLAILLAREVRHEDDVS